MGNLKIAIIVADTDEYKELEKFAEAGEYERYSFLGRKGHRFNISAEGNTAEVTSLLCGIGKVNAAAAATHFADNGYDIILNYGLSGGVSGISRGELCICDRFLEHDFDLTVTGRKPCEKPEQKYIYEGSELLAELCREVVPQVKMGTAVSGDRFICDDAVRQSLKESFGAMSCDMETAAIAYVCDFSGIPFLALRRISDDAGSDAVDSYREMNTADETLLSDYIIKLIKKILSSDFAR